MELCDEVMEQMLSFSSSCDSMLVTLQKAMRPQWKTNNKHTKEQSRHWEPVCCWSFFPSRLSWSKKFQQNLLTPAPDRFRITQKGLQMHRTILGYSSTEFKCMLACSSLHHPAGVKALPPESLICLIPAASTSASKISHVTQTWHSITRSSVQSCSLTHVQCVGSLALLTAGINMRSLP